MSSDSPRTAAERCPRCDSPKPEWHPAMQYEGEVQPCPDPWHDPEGVNIFAIEAASPAASGDALREMTARWRRRSEQVDRPAAGELRGCADELDRWITESGETVVLPQASTTPLAAETSPDTAASPPLPEGLDVERCPICGSTTNDHDATPHEAAERWACPECGGQNIHMKECPARLQQPVSREGRE